VLVEQSINASLGNKPYSQKRHAYGESKLLLTRVVAPRERIGAAGRIDRVVASFEPFLEWNEAGVARRQGALAGLARAAWHVPEAASPPVNDGVSPSSA